MSTQIIIGAPPTTEYTVVFQFDQIGKRFDTGFYTPGLTGGRASLEEINHVLADIENTRRPIASKAISAVCCYILSLFACIGVYIFALISISDSAPDMIPFFIIAFIASMILVIVVFIVRIRKINEETKTKCKAVADRHNQNFASRGLRWHIPVNFPSWIELWKDYQVQNSAGMYLPPPVNQQPYTQVPSYGVPNQGMGGQPQFQPNPYQNYQGQGQPNNNYVPPNSYV